MGKSLQANRRSVALWLGGSTPSDSNGSSKDRVAELVSIWILLHDWRRRSITIVGIRYWSNIFCLECTSMEQSKQKGDEAMDVVDPVRPGMWPRPYRKQRSSREGWILRVNTVKKAEAGESYGLFKYLLVKAKTQSKTTEQKQVNWNFFFIL